MNRIFNFFFDANHFKRIYFTNEQQKGLFDFVSQVR